MIKRKLLEKKNKKNTSIITYISGVLILVIFYSIFHEGFSNHDLRTSIMIWSDALTMSSVIMLGIIGATKLNRIGFFDWIEYSLVLAKFIFTKAKDKEYIDFSDYKDNKERSTIPILPGLVISLSVFFIGIILSIMFYFF